MGVVGLDELLLAELAPQEDEGGQPSRTLSELLRDLDSSSGRLSNQFELVNTIDQLQDEGIIEVEEKTVDSGPIVRLTEEGREEASRAWDRLAEMEVTVIDNEERTQLLLSEAASRFDRSLTEIAAQLSDDRIYYRNESSDQGLLNRIEEIEQCQSVFESVRQTGSGRALFLSGPSGVGKTSLAEAALKDISEDATVRTSRCRGSGTEPFQPLRDAFDDLTSLPSFNVTGSEIDDPDRFVSRQTALFHDLTQKLIPSDENYSVLFLDDLHLADNETMAYLSYLLDNLDQFPLVLFGAYRPSALSDNAPFGDDSGSSPDSNSDVEESENSPVYISLKPLGKESTAGIIEQTVGRRGVPKEFVDVVHKLTGGNPLFVKETVRRLLETDQLDKNYQWYPTDTSEVNVPDAVKKTIRQQIDSLERTERDLLYWAALIGEVIPVDILETVCDLDSMKFRFVVQALVDSDIFTRITDKSLSFRNEIFRESLLTMIDPDKRQPRHSVIAEKMEEKYYSTGGEVTSEKPSKTYPDPESPINDTEMEEGGSFVTADRAAAIATHFEQAGEPALAIDWYTEAGQHAMDVFAHQSAVQHFKDALELANETDDTDRRLQLIERLTEVLFVLSKYDEAERYVRFVRERATDQSRRLRMTVLVSRIANARGNYETAIEEVTEGLRIAEDASTQRGRLLDQKIFAQRRMSELEKGAETAKQLVSMASQIDEAKLQARGHKHLGVIAWRQSDYDTARRHHQKALDLLENLDDPHMVATMYNNLGVFARYQSEYEISKRYLEDALEIYRDLDDRQHVAMASMNLATLEGYRGNFSLADEYSEKALQLYRTVGNQHGQSMARTGIGRNQRLRGNTDVAKEHLQSSLKNLKEIGDERYIGIINVDLGASELEENNLEAARKKLQKGLNTLKSVSDIREQARARMFLALVDIEEENYDMARERLHRAQETFESVGDDHRKAQTDQALGHLAAKTDKKDVAVECWKRALTIFERIGAVAEELEILERLVKEARRQGNDEQHRERLERARDLIDDTPNEGFETHRKWIEHEEELLDK